MATLATIADNQEFIIDVSNSIKVTNPDSNVYFTIEWYWGDTSASGISSGKGMKGTVTTLAHGTSISWKPPAEMGNIIPNDIMGQGTFIIKSYNATGSVYHGETKAIFKAKVPDTAKPVIDSFNIEPYGDSTSIEWGVYIKGRTQCKATIASAHATYGATIKKYEITCNYGRYTQPVTYDDNTQKSGVTKVLIDSSDIYFWVYDSRGRQGLYGTSIAVQDLYVPSIKKLTANRCKSDGTLDDDGTYATVLCDYNFASVDRHNTCSATVKYKKSDESSWSSEIVLDDNVKKTIGGSFNVDYSYDIMFTVADAFTSVTKTLIISPSFNTMDFKKGGRAAAFGKSSEKYGVLECAFDIEAKRVIEKCTYIDANNSLDQRKYIRVGQYACSTNATAQSLADCPTRVAFKMFVINGLGDTYNLPQPTIDDVNNKYATHDEYNNANSSQEERLTWAYRTRIIVDIDAHIYTQRVQGGERPGIYEYGEWFTSLDTNNFGSLTSKKYSLYNNNALAFTSYLMWTGEYNYDGRKIYSLAAPVKQYQNLEWGNRSFDITCQDFKVYDVWIDNRMSHWDIKSEDGNWWECRTLNNTTSGDNGAYISEAWVNMSTDGTKLQCNIYFGKNRLKEKYLYLYLLMTLR